MATVYNEAGEARELLDSVDAREYVATGRWFHQPPAPAADPAIEAAAAPSDAAAPAAEAKPGKATKKA